MQGSIKGRSNITNAKLYEKSKNIIQLDVENFFPSITSKYIYNLWRYFFHFSDEVSTLLVNLTTLDGNLIQGSPLSSDIANLIFWDKEQEFVRNLQKYGLVYSRYVDDITISSKGPVSNKSKANAIKCVHSMLKSKGLKLKHNKTQILGQNSRMIVTGNVINDTNKVSQEYIDNVYKEINNKESGVSSLQGEVNYIGQTRPKVAKRLNKIIN